MEFFRQWPVDAGVTPARLQQALGIEQLASVCASIDRVIEAHGEQGRIYCLWGEFNVHREAIRQGLRFTLPGCPNALAWTITVSDNRLTVHCTIDRQQHEADFIESLEQFMDDWQNGLQKHF